MATARLPNFREGNPNTDLADPMSRQAEFQSNQNLSGGRDLARPLEPGLLAGFKQPANTKGGRKGRKSNTK